MHVLCDPPHSDFTFKATYASELSIDETSLDLQRAITRSPGSARSQRARIRLAKVLKCRGNLARALRFPIMATTLVAMPAVERLSPAVIRILGGNPGKFTLQGTNTYLLGTGQQRILIDTGEGKSVWLSSLRSILEQENAVVETALITHWHRDHVGGVGDLLKLSPQTRVYKHDPGAGQENISEGQRFQVEGATLAAAHTPGHTKDHFVFLLAEEDAMFTADNVLGHGTAVFEDLAQYLASLKRMEGMFRGRAYPGHGPVIENGRGKIAEYIAHRKQRERQVLDVMRSKTDDKGDLRAWQPMEIVKAIYSEVPESLHVAACGGVLQVLGKLREDGTAADRGDGAWRLLQSTANM